MKKLLYGTTAMVAAGLIAGTVSNEAWAQGKTPVEKIQIGVGGYFQAFGVYGSQEDGVGDPAANLRDTMIEREAEIIFNGKTTLDNGLEVGAQVQLEAETCSDQIDESFIWFEGGWGRINLGSENSAAYLMHYAAPAPSGNSAWGLNTPNESSAEAGSALLAVGQVFGPRTQPNLTSDSEKITYFTPRLAGFQFGASYSPDLSEEGQTGGGTYSGFLPDNTVGGLEDIIEVGVNYVNKLGALDVALSGSYGTASLQGNNAAGTLDDREEIAVGGQIGFGGFTVGAGYRNDDNGNVTNATVADVGDRDEYNVGVRYAFGPWGVGVEYAHITQEFTALTGGDDEDELDAYEVGGSYDLGPGIMLQAGVQFWDETNESSGATNGENEATIVYVGTSLSF